MRKVQRSLIIILISISTILTACAGPGTPENTEPDGLTISVSILPEKYFVERIGGDRVRVNVMVGPGDSPHSYEPKASQMAALSNSDVYFQIGVEFEEAWMERIAGTNPDMKIVDLSQSIAYLPAAAHNEDADHAGTDDPDEMDPHIWTSPANSAAISAKIAETLAAIDPQNADTYQVNLAALQADITNLQADITAALEKLDSRKFMVFHPAWGYFADEFDLEQIPIEAAGSEPSARELADLIQQARAKGITVIFAQPEFSTRSADYIASEIGGKVVLISPLAENWLENMRMVAETFAEEL